MFLLLKELFALLTHKQRKKFYKLQFLVFVMAVFEVIGIASIGPFMALVADISLLKNNQTFAWLYKLSGVDDPYHFLSIFGVIVFLILGVASCVSMITTWKLSMFSFQTGTELADRLYRHYLRQTWLFHASESSSKLIKQLSTETVRITSHVILPMMQLIAKAVVIVLIVTSIFIYNPTVAISGFLLFSTGYIILHLFVRTRLTSSGENISFESIRRFRLMNEGFGGIKDVLLLNRSESFIQQFEESGKAFSKAHGQVHALSQVPRYAMEFLAFGGMISLVLLLIKINDGNLGEILPILAVYGIAGLKLLPAVQQAYANFALIKGNIQAFIEVKPDLIASTITEENNKRIGSSTKTLVPQKNISITNAIFSYPNKETNVLDGMNITIKANHVIGIVGPSGAGKSTIIDVLLGLISLNQGELLIDDIVIDNDNLRSWQNTIGFVPQSIFLSEGTISENIAFGIPPQNIDENKILHVIEISRLGELISTLPNGINTKVGERGVQLSGGQRQRIGIARALYNDASVLIFDEATSALDGVTEKLIMDAIHDFNGEKTIILIAHRLKTVKECDMIFYIEHGKVSDQGTYSYLLENNKDFRALARYA